MPIGTALQLMVHLMNKSCLVAGPMKGTPDEKVSNGSRRHMRRRALRAFGNNEVF